MSELDQPNFNEMPIGKLREYAAHLRVPLAKTATKQEIIQAILAKLNGNAAPLLAHVEETNGLKPGYSRIKILEDPSPEATNAPVYINDNGLTYHIHRGVEVIVPNRVVRNLTNATVKTLRQVPVRNESGIEIFRTTEIEIPSYPFQVLETRPGPEVYSQHELARQKANGPRIRYKKLFGRWPSPRDMARALEKGLISIAPEESTDKELDTIMDQMEKSDDIIE